MIICPLTNDECPKLVSPKPKEVFIMSAKQMGKDLNVIKKKVFSELKKSGFKVVIGAELAGIGDYFCDICQHIIGCPFGIVFFDYDMRPSTLCNIFTEKGLMQGFGKPVIIFVNKLSNLPSDFSRDFVVSYENKKYIQKFRKIIKKIKSLQKYYFDIGDIALDAGDFEKTSRYYKQAYLIGGVDRKNKIKNFIDSLNNDNIQSKGMKERILDDLKSFYKLSDNYKFRRNK